MRVEDFDYPLPPERIAQQPLTDRAASLLLVVHRDSGEIEHHRFRDLPEYLRAGDLLVVNDTRVMPARLIGRKRDTGGRVEVLLEKQLAPDRWEALVKPGRRLQVGAALEFGDGQQSAEIVGRTAHGGRLIEFSGDVTALMESCGAVPLPPYIHTALADANRYQTVYSRDLGSSAAPTAGLHFTPELLAQVEAMGVGRASVTLNIGMATFRPIRTERIEDHNLHSEWIRVPPETAEAVNRTHERGGRVIAVGTTSVRALEGCADDAGQVSAWEGETRLYITPGYRFRAVDALLTNFHMPRSTLLVMVCAFAGRELILRAYQEALAGEYRFLSFGDAMLIV